MFGIVREVYEKKKRLKSTVLENTAGVVTQQCCVSPVLAEQGWSDMSPSWLTIDLRVVQETPCLVIGNDVVHDVGLSSTGEMRSWQTFLLVWCSISLSEWGTTCDELRDVIRSLINMAWQLAYDICTVVAISLTFWWGILCTVHCTSQIISVVCTFLRK